MRNAGAGFQQNGRRLWDDARAERPQIHERGRQSFFPGLLEVPFDKFSEFYRKFLSEAKPESPLDAYGLHRLLALGIRHAGNSGVKKDLGIEMDVLLPSKRIIAFRLLLPGLLALRDIFIRFGASGEKATDYALQNAELVPFTPHWSRSGVKSLSQSMAETLGSVSPGKSASARRISSMLREYYRAKPACGIEKTFEINPLVLEKLAHSFNGGLKTARGLFSYPFTRTRLTAVLGSGLDDSFHCFFYHGYNFVSIAGGKAVGKSELSGSHAAAIRMYPWEADHLLKAEAMLARGIPAAEPLGRLFLGEQEFGLFQWVEGVTVNESGEPSAWREFGRAVRLCHENGVGFEDAAGRNAVWNGKSSVKLIDLEHTIILPEAKRIESVERVNAITRIRSELEAIGNREFFNAFVNGYNQPLG